ncbi:MAG: hypothetical protein CYG59_22850 [Chloroflexi bacterium]|nr:MAG: hypothetical protein CYG59_22850 [Chloroflexota bacterium]
MANEIDRFRQPQERGLSTIFNRSAAASQRDQARQMANVKQDVQVTAFKVDGAAAVAGYTMERAVQLDMQRRALADGDETLNSILIEIEVGFIQQAKSIQRRLYDGWGI